MPYQRKTRDYWDIEQYFPGSGWEVVSSCATRQEARSDIKAYLKNQPEYPVRSKKRRERIEQ